MKKILQLTVLLSFSVSFGQATLPIYEGFVYPVGDKLVTYSTDLLSVASSKGSWSEMLPSSGGVVGPFKTGQDDVLIATSPSWTKGLTPAGQAISFKGSGGDHHLPFKNPNTSSDNKTTTGSIYAAFVFKVTDNTATTALSETQLLAFGLPNSTGVSTSIGSSMMLRTSATGKGLTAGTGSFNIGIDKNGSGATSTTWGAIDYPVGTDVFIVINYNFSDNTANIWINPSTSAQQTLPTLTATTGSNRAYFDRIRIQQSASASTPTLFLDEIRVATSWSEVLGGAAPPASPLVESRQVFNSSSNPTVANLVPAPSTTIKWYATIDGSELPSTTSINSGTYYVSQTTNSLESDKASTNVYVGDTSLKTLPLYESFDYIIGDKLIVMKNGAKTTIAENPGIGLGSWTIIPSDNITADVAIVASPTWTNTVLPSASNKAISFAGSGVDPELKFTNTTTGSLFSSFVFTAADVTSIVNAQVAGQASADADYLKLNPGATIFPPFVLDAGIDAAKSTPTGFYGFLSESTDPNTGVVSTSYASDVMFRKVFGTTNKFNLGLSKSSSSTDCVWSPAEYDFGTQHLIVISYENIGDAVDTNQVANLWIDPATSTQPAVTLTQNNPISAVDGSTPVKITRSNIDRIKIVQASSSSTPTLVIDEIRVANNWGEALGTTSTLGLSPKVAVNSQCTVYPNPVSNGKLYISSPSNSQKQVAIYSILGQKVLDAKTSNNAEINVSKLAKGNYILKITEDGKSDAKKLIIQ